MMRHFRRILLAAACLLTLSCTKAQRELTYANQETSIDKFITNQKENYPDARVVYNEGAVRMVLSEGNDVELSARGTVEFYFAGYDFSGGNISNDKLFATNNPEFAASVGWTLSDESAFTLKKVNLADTDILEGLKRGLVGVRADEDCYILFSGKYAYGKSAIGTIPANAPLVFRVWVKTVEN